MKTTPLVSLRHECSQNAAFKRRSQGSSVEHRSLQFSRQSRPGISKAERTKMAGSLCLKATANPQPHVTRSFPALDLSITLYRWAHEPTARRDRKLPKRSKHVNLLFAGRCLSYHRLKTTGPEPPILRFQPVPSDLS